MLDKSRGGVVRTVAGGLVAGSLDDVQSKINDPDGVGYFTLDTGKQLVDIYADEFSELVTTW